MSKRPPAYEVAPGRSGARTVALIDGPASPPARGNGRGLAAGLHRRAAYRALGYFLLGSVIHIIAPHRK